MSTIDFAAFLAAANDELRRKQRDLQSAYGLGSFSRWKLDGETKLQFFDRKDNLRLEADVIDVGSYSPEENTWKWTWSNTSFPARIREQSEKLKELEAMTGIRMFGMNQAFKIDGEPMAWELAAMALKHLGAVGCYRTPSVDRGPMGFLAIMSVEQRG